MVFIVLHTIGNQPKLDNAYRSKTTTSANCQHGIALSVYF